MELLLVVESGKCTGCRICEMACALSKTGEANPERSRIRIVRTEEDTHIFTAPVVCLQCEKPVCQMICPTDAIYLDPNTGAKLVNPDKCVGCRACIYVCPFGASMFDPARDIAVRCDLCEGDPVCVKSCPFEALSYAQIEDAQAKLRVAGLGKYLDIQKLGVSP